MTDPNGYATYEVLDLRARRSISADVNDTLVDQVRVAFGELVRGEVQLHLLADDTALLPRI